MLFALLVGCSDPKQKIIPLDKAKWDEEMRPVMGRLSAEERNSLKEYLARLAPGGDRRVNRVPPGTTIAEAIVAQRQFIVQREHESREYERIQSERQVAAAKAAQEQADEEKRMQEESIRRNQEQKMELALRAEQQSRAEEERKRKMEEERAVLEREEKRVQERLQNEQERFETDMRAFLDQVPRFSVRIKLIEKNFGLDKTLVVQLQNDSRIRIAAVKGLLTVRDVSGDELFRETLAVGPFNLDGEIVREVEVPYLNTEKERSLRQNTLSADFEPIWIRFNGGAELRKPDPPKGLNGNW